MLITQYWSSKNVPCCTSIFNFHENTGLCNSFQDFKLQFSTTVEVWHLLCCCQRKMKIDKTAEFWKMILAGTNLPNNDSCKKKRNFPFFNDPLLRPAKDGKIDKIKIYLRTMNQFFMIHAI